MSRTPLPPSQRRQRLDLTLPPDLIEWARATYPDLSVSQVVTLLIRGLKEGRYPLTP